MLRAINQMKIKIAVCLFASLLAIVFLNVESSHAATSSSVPASVTIAGGNLSIDAENSGINFGTVTLSNTVQKITKSVGNINESDLTGSGAGWHVSVQATQFSSDNGHTFPLGSLKLTAPEAITATDGTTSEPPVAKSGAPWVIDSENAVTILSAAKGTGMGTYTSTFGDLTLSVPANVYLGSYSSTLTWSIISAP